MGKPALLDTPLPVSWGNTQAHSCSPSFLIAPKRWNLWARNSETLSLCPLLRKSEALHLCPPLSRLHRPHLLGVCSPGPSSLAPHTELSIPPASPPIRTNSTMLACAHARPDSVHHSCSNSLTCCQNALDPPLLWLSPVPESFLTVHASLDTQRVQMPPLPRALPCPCTAGLTLRTSSPSPGTGAPHARSLLMSTHYFIPINTIKDNRTSYCLVVVSWKHWELILGGNSLSCGLTEVPLTFGLPVPH